jgi:hypothetical protein
LGDDQLDRPAKPNHTDTERHGTVHYIHSPNRIMTTKPNEPERKEYYSNPNQQARQHAENPNDPKQNEEQKTPNEYHNRPSKGKFIVPRILHESYL